MDCNGRGECQVRVLLEVKGERVCVAISTPQGLDFQAEGELKLDERTTPRSLNWFNFIGPGEQPLPEIAAVYKVEGDTFTVCNGGFHGTRPKEFRPGEIALADVVIFRRPGSDDSAHCASAGSAPRRSPVPGPGSSSDADSSAARTVNASGSSPLSDHGQPKPSGGQMSKSVSLFPGKTTKQTR